MAVFLMVFKGVIVVFSLLLLCTAIQVPLSNSQKSPFTADFDALTSKLLDRWHCPGLAIAVIDGNDTFSKGYGIERYPDKPVTPNTLFYTGSTTKSFTAAAISLLIDETANTSHPFTWQTPLVSVLRENFVLQDSWATTHVTLEDALSHRTGMPGHDMSWVNTTRSLKAVVRKFRHLPATAEIRTKWQYCNMMYITMSYFIETFTGMWLGDFLKDRIYDPLKMTSTFFSLADAKAAVSVGNVTLAKGYFWIDHTQKYLPLSYMDSPVVSGAGATISNVLDYTRWLRCLMSMSGPLSIAGHQALRLPRITRGPIAEKHAGFRGPDSYALGLDVSNYRGKILIWHNGGLPGFGTVMAFLPRLQWGVVMMANTLEGGSMAQQVLLFKLVDDLLNVPEEDRFDWEVGEEAGLRQGAYVLEHAREIAYPDAPDPGVPLTLPLEDYAGVYTHPAYPPFNLSLTESMLQDKTPSCLYTISYLQLNDDPIYIFLQHVTGEYFLLYSRKFTKENWDPAVDSRPMQDGVTKAEFRLGEDGRVRELGITVEPEMGDEKIWWRRE